jgi:hypothetical protein
LALATNILLGVTGFAAVTTLVFALDTDWRRPGRRERAGFVPVAGPGGGGLTIIGRY